MFTVHDSWIDRTVSYTDDHGFELYKLVSGEMIGQIWTDQDYVLAEDVINYLNTNKINKIYNPIFEIAGKYSGAEGYDKDQDGDFKHINPLSSSDDLSEFLDAGIEIVGI